MTSSLREAVTAHRKAPGSRCSMCTFLAGLTPAEQAEWRDILEDSSITHREIRRFVATLEDGPSANSPEHHRTSGHPNP